MDKAYIFDLDGTLVDSMYTWCGVFTDLLREKKVEVPEDIINIITPLGNVGAAEYCIKLGLDMTVEQVMENNHKTMIKKYSEEIPAKSNVKETLERLKKEGYSLNVLTASPHIYIDPCLKRLKIFDLFDNVWSIDDFGHTKNEVVIYEMVAQRLNKDIKDCIFVDDNLTVLKTVKESGMIAMGIYDEFSKAFSTQIQEISDIYIKDFSEI